MRKFLVGLSIVLLLMVFVSVPVMAGSNSDALSHANANAGNYGIVAGQVIQGANIPNPLPFGVETHYPNGPTYLGSGETFANVQDVRQLVGMISSWNRQVLKSVVKNANIRFRSRSFVKTLKDSVIGPQRMTEVVLSADLSGVIPVGHVTIEADDYHTTTLEILARACLLAQEMGADAIVIMGQGFNKKVASSGWGIGVNSTTTTINKGGDLGTVNSGGTGYSSGKAGHMAQPWLQILAVKYR